ncbi:glycosyltransferase [Chitinophagaceae bacterium LB-8]|uniref:Glycosyltransferase n=1 Tax=Paraflavisolibacter caeni TaxID=2982496 RepID=A0A9X3B8W4_9BACT|nr:glycosyltransferase [Paraflavisolibacter caeni]MCU7550281.1 glycosyltransferase [Paraflavisolibacter caeni]
MSRKNILWLASWYPNRYDKFNGDFIQRHAQAASIDNDIYVIHLQDAIDISGTDEEVNTQGGLTEKIIYYKKGSGILGKLVKQIRFFTIYKNAINEYVQKHGLPHCVHVHVPWKAGLLALWVKRKYRVPYLVTEHWGIYNDIVEDNIFTKPLYVRKLLAHIINESERLITVSAFIGKCINNLIASKEFIFVPNVVNTNYFKFSGQKYKRFTFLHVSNMVELKNVNGILQAFKIFLDEKNPNVQLVLIGNQNYFYEKKAIELGIPSRNLNFKGEVLYDEVAKEMQQSHCLILNSNIENSPCVIGEGLCCGLPVIATRVGGIPELVNEVNSILIEPQNIDNLVFAMKELYNNYLSFDGRSMSENAKQMFSCEIISKKLNDIYWQIEKVN